MTILLDIETRSRADLPEVGAYRYGCDPSTEVLMMGITTEDESQPVWLWVNPKYESAGVKSDPYLGFTQSQTGCDSSSVVMPIMSTSVDGSQP